MSLWYQYHAYNTVFVNNKENEISVVYKPCYVQNVCPQANSVHYVKWLPTRCVNIFRQNNLSVRQFWSILPWIQPVFRFKVLLHCSWRKKCYKWMKNYGDDLHTLPIFMNNDENKSQWYNHLGMSIIYVHKQSQLVMWNGYRDNVLAH